MSPASPERFSNLLTDAIQWIAFRQHKTRQAVQDEVGYAMGRSGGAAIAYWIYRKRLPARLADIENLARLIAQRGGWEDPANLLAFLEAAGHPNAEQFSRQVFPSHVGEAASPQEGMEAHLYVPFVVGPPVMLPRQFFGRTLELKRIFQALHGPPLQNVALVGKARSGKTSLLHYVKTISRSLPAQLRHGQYRAWLPESPRYLWAFVDFEDPRMAAQDGFFRHVLAQLQIPAPNTCNLSSFVDAICQQLSSPAVILMDNLVTALNFPELNHAFWSALRSLSASLTDGRLGFVITMQKWPKELASEYSNPIPFCDIFGHLLELGPLTYEEASEFLDGSLSSCEPADREWMLETSHGWPALLQILAMAYWSHLEEKSSTEDWKAAALRSIARYPHLLETD